MKRLMPALLAAAYVIAMLCPAPAEDWPQQPIRIIVSFGPGGGGADIIGRILADAMQEKLGKPVVVENKPGAGGIIGNELVGKATPDGYTLGIMTAGQIIAAVTRKDMPYDTAALTPVAQIASASLLIATRPDFPAGKVPGTGRRRQSRSGQNRLRQSGFCRHAAFRRRTVQAGCRRQSSACAVPLIAGGHQCGAGQSRRRFVRYGVGAARPGAVRHVESVGCHRQGTLSRRAERAARDRVQPAARL